MALRTMDLVHQPLTLSAPEPALRSIKIICALEAQTEAIIVDIVLHTNNDLVQYAIYAKASKDS